LEKFEPKALLGEEPTKIQGLSKEGDTIIEKLCKSGVAVTKK
jgi:hypothetical protein